MKQKHIENTLFLGNGFSRTIFNNIPSWGELLQISDSPISNYTIRYETYRMKKSKETEEGIKKELIRKITAAFSSQNIMDNTNDLKQFGEYLLKCNVNNIITTNYDNGIELILCDFCGYKEDKSKVTAERIYSIRTHKLLVNEKSGHAIKIWKIHGDLDRIKSITLGLDQYCGALAKLTEYVKGTYKSSQSNNGVECKISMEEKCSKQIFDNISWAELFFKTNVCIVGFGMDFSEIDIWWLIDKRARLMLAVPEIKNRIEYLYNPEYDKVEEKAEIFAALKAFGVSTKAINNGESYIKNITLDAFTGLTK